MLNKLLYKLIKPSLRVNSFAQAGEDRILEFLFGSMGIRRITYIDIGANEPVFCNNTYFFYTRKGSGVLIEPDPVFNSILKKMRPRDTVVEAAINDKEGEAELYIFDEPSVNTLSKEEAELRQASGRYKLTSVKKIPLLTIEHIIVNKLQGTIPHVISLDVEGVDYAVLKAFDFEKYPVPVWIVETCAYSENHIKPKVNNIIELMTGKGYFVYADTYINTIFVNTKWFNDYGR